VCVLLLAACGGGGSSGESKKSADQIVADAQKAARAAHAVHVSGSIVQGRGRLSLDLHIVRNAGAEGEIGLQGGKVRLVRVGTKVYLNGDVAFWTQFGSASTARRLQGRWLRVPATRSDLGLLFRVTDLDTFFSGTLRSHGRLAKAGTRTYKSRKVIAIDDTGSSGGTLYVAASGPPYPYAILGPNGGKQGAIDFSDWNKTVTIEAPKGAVDLSGVTGAG
jgi:hypothetical protein